MPSKPSISESFAEVFNYHFSAIVVLKSKIKGIQLKYTGSSNYSRNYYNIHLTPEIPETISVAEETIIKTLIAPDKRGIYVSYLDSLNGDIDVDLEEMREFIKFYKLSASFIDGFIRNILPPECKIEVMSLDADPFFVYMEKLLSRVNYPQNQSFSKIYLELMKSNFTQDVKYHPYLLKLAKKTLSDNALTVTDNELNGLNGGTLADIRNFVMNMRVPYRIKRMDKTIDSIEIESAGLRESILKFKGDNYKSANASVISSYLKKQEDDSKLRKEKILARITATGLALGDYILVELNLNGKDSQDIGKINEAPVYQNGGLLISYILLKKNLSEGLSIKSTVDLFISYICKEKTFLEEIRTQGIKDKLDALKVFKEKGIKNPHFSLK